MDIIGAAQLNSYSIVLYCYPSVKHKRLLINHTFTSENIENLLKILQSMINFQKMPLVSSPIYKKKLKVLVNPTSGQGKVLKS